MARKRRELQEINAGSMADIAFLLLIFFLVATQIQSDFGIMRLLPPPVPPDMPPPPKINKRNIFVVLLNADDKLLVRNNYGNIDKLKDQVKEFVSNPNEKSGLSAKHPSEDIPLIGPYEVSKGIVSLQNDRGTSYEMYIQVQNELTAAFNELREELCQKKFGMAYDTEKLTKKQIAAIRKAIPLRISEAEPRRSGDAVGG